MAIYRKRPGPPLTTGKFETREELEDYIFEECRSKKRPQKDVAVEAGVSVGFTHNLLHGTASKKVKPIPKMIKFLKG